MEERTYKKQQSSLRRQKRVKGVECHAVLLLFLGLIIFEESIINGRNQPVTLPEKLHLRCDRKSHPCNVCNGADKRKTLHHPLAPLHQSLLQLYQPQPVAIANRPQLLKGSYITASYLLHLAQRIQYTNALPHN